MSSPRIQRFEITAEQQPYIFGPDGEPIEDFEAVYGKTKTEPTIRKDPTHLEIRGVVENDQESTLGKLVLRERTVDEVQDELDREDAPEVEVRQEAIRQSVPQGVYKYIRQDPNELDYVFEIRQAITRYLIDEQGLDHETAITLGECTTKHICYGVSYNLEIMESIESIASAIRRKAK